MELIKKYFSALIAVISSMSVLGGGFYAYGVFENRIAQLEEREYVITQEIDLVPVYEKMEQSKEVVTNKMGERFREQNTEITVLENRVTETEKSIAVLQAEFDLLDLQMEEFTLKNSNPLQ